jgi:hypothetical protein
MMAEQQWNAAIPRTSATIKRRGILAAGAAVAGILAQRAAQPVQATSGGGPDGNFVLGSNISNSPNTSGGVSILAPLTIFLSSHLLFVDAPFNSNNNTPPNLGALAGSGRNQGTGVTGVSGTTGTTTSFPSGYPALNTGVLGYGVNGATGVQGMSVSSNGVYGTSSTGYGIVGYTTGGSASLSGISTNVNIPAFAGGNSVAGGVAASFGGTVFVNGKLVVSDPSYKSGLLKHPDGSSRLVYCIESPESWIEDFGTGTLVNGKAVVSLDPDFAAVVQTQGYLVFLTETGAHSHLAVTAQTASGFTVEAETAGASGGFNWRVVAKPKTDKKLSRLEKFTPPQVKLPDPATLPQPPTAASSGSPPDAVQSVPSSRSAPSAAVPQGSGATQGSGTIPVQPAPPPRP